MMNIDAASLTTVLLLSTSLLLGAATIAILRMQCLLRKSAHLPAGVSAASSQSGTAAAEALEQRVGALQTIVDELAGKQDMPQQKGRHEVPLEQAVRMARCGAGIDDLIRSCGLKKGEAELLLKLHANREPGAAARPH
jgi:hypothetical protein